MDELQRHGSRVTVGEPAQRAAFSIPLSRNVGITLHMMLYVP